METSNLTITITMQQASVRTDMMEYHRQKAEEFREMARTAHLKRDQSDFLGRAMVHDDMIQFWENVVIV